MQWRHVVAERPWVAMGGHGTQCEAQQKTCRGMAKCAMAQQKAGMKAHDTMA